ncbi:MAG: hypothetical protein EXQ93_07095 [Alphaproteobacteria bacterium]|nr:hypothetical protein [Alphaproteobacteria bacterium]
MRGSVPPTVGVSLQIDPFIPVSAGEVIAGVFTSTALVTHDLSYYVSIPALQVVAPATYADTVVVRLYEGTLSSYTQRDSVTI